jgi:hypothetical protein
MAKPTDLEIDVLYAICESARLLNSHAALSVRQKLMVALILNRWDWLWDMNFSIPMAIEHIGSRGVALVCEVEKRHYRNDE